MKGVNFGVLYWYEYYLANEVKMDPGNTSLITTVNEIGKAIGGILLGFFSDKMNSR